jgi:endonuclease/exonuclease/phosphatase family metal-dependent hydrolase
VQERPVHVIVVHLGLISASRLRQVAQLQRYIEREVPAQAPLVVAGDFNDWGTQIQRAMQAMDLTGLESGKFPTYPSRLPIVQLDHVYARGLRPLRVQVPRGKIWGQMSDHLPLIAEFGL